MSRTTKLGFALLLVASLTACSKPPAPPRAEEHSAPAVPIDPATTASITGIISFQGTPSAPRNIDMSADPFCQGSNQTESLVVTDGKLANVFVYVKDGLGNRAFPIPTDPVLIDQNGCRYKPHVVGAMTGQTVRFLNSDPTVHNIHPSPEANPAWNQSQQPKSSPLDKTFDRPEIMIPVKCNQHPWMKMYVNVVSHPFYAVTKSDGSYEIRGLPPGEYTIAMAHEKLGMQEFKVTLKAKQSAAHDATFHE